MKTSRGGRVRKLLALDRRGVAELLSAQAALLHAQLLVWTRPAGQLVSTAPVVPLMAAFASQPAAAALALAVERAAENGIFRPKCLVRAVALHRLLEAYAIHGSRIRLGVRRRNGRFLAHAWVELGGTILGDDAHHVRRFVPLTGNELS